MPTKSALVLPSSQALRKSNTSVRFTPLALLKSARQQGVVTFPATLHAARIGTYIVLAPVQLAAAATIEHVTPRQHAPVVIGHGGGRHPVSLPRYVEGDTHAVRSPIVHTALGVQQAPVGCGQGLVGVQVVAAPWKTPPHSALSPTAHVPSDAQHAPLGEAAHPLAAHATPVCHDEIPAHAE